MFRLKLNCVECILVREHIYDQHECTTFFSPSTARSAPTSNSELFSNGIFASTNGIPSFGLSNGLGKTHDVTAISNGYVDYQVISRNGIHGTEKREPSPELTVGHGRPKSSPRQQKRSGSDFENGENLSYGLFPFTPEVDTRNLHCDAFFLSLICAVLLFSLYCPCCVHYISLSLCLVLCLATV